MSPISDAVVKALLVALAIAILFGGAQTVRLSSAQKTLAETVAVHARQRADAEAAAREAELANHRAALAHAEQQQTIVAQYETKLRAITDARRADSEQLARVRKSLAEYASGGRLPAESDSDAVRRLADRVVVLGRLLEEGAGLVDASVELVERRDAEVTLLRDLLTNDSSVVR